MNNSKLTGGSINLSIEVLELFSIGLKPLHKDLIAGVDSAVAGLRELQERRKADSAEPVYQYRIRNGYNGQATEWQTIRRDQVDFVLKAQPHNAEFRIISAPPAPTVTFYRDGIEAAATWVDQQRESYDSEHGRHDPDTGLFEFGNDAQRDYSATLEEIAEGIRGLHPNAAPSTHVVPDEKPMPKASNMFAIDAVAAIAEARGWNACRAAMLKGDTNDHL